MSQDNEIDQMIFGLEQEAKIRAVSSIDEDPERAARAVHLARAMDTTPEVVHADLDNFEADHKTQLVSDILDNDPDVAEYIRQNPINAALSNGDLGTLSNIAQQGRAFKFLWDQSPFHVFVQGTVDAAKSAAMSPMSMEEFEATKDRPFSRAAVDLLNVPRRAFGVLMAPVEGAQETIRHVGKLVGDETGADKLARDIGGLVESEMLRGHGPNLEAIAKRAAFQKFVADRAEGNTAPSIESWLREGKEPPLGLDPTVDQAKADLTEGALDDLLAAIQEANGSLTRQRDAASFRGLPEQVYGKSSIAISGDRVADLYRDTMPEPDDGLLGWVPDLDTKLEAARAFGEDVHIPLADFITHIDPALAKELHDDLRVWPSGVTINEVKDVAEPTQVVDSPMAQARFASGTEPMFAFGDKKLSLQQLAAVEGFDEFHEFQFLDEKGKPVGEITILPDPAKKQLYVANINGLGGLYANTFGPSLIRDLKRQLKELYPDYETITGHRVSGAREVAGTYEDKVIGNPVVKLSLDWTMADTRPEYMDFREILENTARLEFDWGISARAEPTELLLPHQAKLAQIINEEITRITGGTAETHVVSNIKYADFPDTVVRGISLGGNAKPLQILVDLFGADPVGIARHETIHHLKRSGMFSPAEWNSLVKAARNENWIGRYGIEDRYPHLDLKRQYEEAIAEGFRDWANTKDNVQHPDTLITRAFQKILELWEAVKVRFKELTGMELNADELFTQVHEGKTAERSAVSGNEQPMLAVDETPEKSADAKLRFEALRAETAGLDQKTFKRLQDAIQARFDEDLEAARKSAEKAKKKELSKEWKERTNEIRKEVREKTLRRPDVAVDMLIGAGYFDGKELNRRFPLLAKDLTDEQKAALPRHYYSNTGLRVDDMAALFGYESGNSMLERLIEYNADRGKRTAREHADAVIEQVTEQVLAQRHGSLQENILAEAEDLALSETNLNLLLEEWQGAAMQAGVDIVDKAVVAAEVDRVFNNTKISDVNSGRVIARIQQHYNKAARALLNGKPAEALEHLQRRYELALFAAKAKKLEKAVDTFQNKAKRLGKREVAGIPAEFTNMVHYAMSRVGLKVQRTQADIAKEISASGYSSLKGFVESKAADQYVIQVWDQLFDPNWSKDFENLTAEEFYALKDSIDSLTHVGRQEMKVLREGIEEDKEQLIADMVRTLEEFKEVPLDKGTLGLRPGGKVRQAFETFVAGHINMVNFFDRWDKWDFTGGIWNQTIFRMMSEAAGQFGSDQIKYAEVFKTLVKSVGKDWLNRTVENPIFRNPRNGALMRFTNKNLLTVMLYTGTKASRVKMAKGYGIEVGDMMSWIHSVATKDHWDFVQSIWDNVFADIKKDHDIMMRNLSGIPVKDVEAEPIETPFGTYRGGYMRIKYHPEFKQTSKKLIGRDPLESEDFFGIVNEPGFTKDRTGYIGPMILDLDALPAMVNDMLHDIAYRPAVLNAAKVLKDPRIQEAVAKHVGGEVRDELIPWLRGIVNATASPGKNLSVLNQWSEALRQNVVFSLVGLNVGTILKHTPTALGTSLKEVGVKTFAHGFRALFLTDPKTGESNYQLMMRLSNEMRLRNRNWEQSVYGSTRDLFPGAKGVEALVPLRQAVIEFSSKPIAWGDFMSAGPTWLGKYMEEMNEHGVTGRAVYAADRAVQRAHGSVSEIYRSPMQRDLPKWFTSIFNFWSDILNRQFETYWKAGEAINAVKEGDKKQAMRYSKEVAAGLFTYWVYAAFIEHEVAGGGESDESWGKAAAKAMLHTATGGWVGIRDATSMVERAQGGDPQIGLAGTAFGHVFKVFTDFTKDDPINKKHLGRVLQDGASFVGATTGLVSDQMGRAVRYAHDVNAGVERPKDAWGWMVGLRFGTTKHHSPSFDDWMKGKVRK